MQIELKIFQEKEFLLDVSEQTGCWPSHFLDQGYFEPELLDINHILYILFTCF